MPKLICDKESAEVDAKESLVSIGEKLGIPFSCEDGQCGTCLVEVKRGLENFTPLTEKEENFGLEPNERLICQAKLKSGEAEVDY